jgi:hypothetical protein
LQFLRRSEDRSFSGNGAVERTHLHSQRNFGGKAWAERAKKVSPAEAVKARWLAITKHVSAKAGAVERKPRNTPLNLVISLKRLIYVGIPCPREI